MIPDVLYQKWHEAREKLIEENSVVLSPEPAPNTLEHAQWRDAVNAWKPPDLHGMRAACDTLFSVFLEHCPKFGNGLLDATLTDAIRDKGGLVDKLMRGLIDVFPRTFETCCRNSVNLNGKNIVMPSAYKGDPLLYLDNTPLLPPFFTSVPFGVPIEQRFAGTWVVAPSGKGKTNLLHALLLEDLGTTASIILIDSKMTGDLITPYKTYRAIRDRLIVIEPKPGLAINPLNIARSSPEAAIGLMTYIFSGLLETALTPLQSTLFRYILRALIESYQLPTIKDFQAILEKGVPKEAPLRWQLRSFFDNEFPTKTYSETRQQLQWRLRLLLDNPIMESMLSCSETKIDLAKEMNGGMIIVIDANKEKLSDVGAEFYQRFWIALILNAAHRRGGQEGWQKRPCFVYIDECQTAIRNDPNIVTILDECRSARIGITLAHQRVSQLSAPVQDALANCAVKYANAEDDAAHLAPKFRTTTEKMRHRTGTFSCYVRDMGTYTISAPRLDLTELPQMTEEERDGLTTKMGEYYVSAQDILKSSQESIAEHTAPTTVSDPDNISTKPSKRW